MKNTWPQTTLKDLCDVDWGNTKLTKAAYIENGQFLAVSAAGCDGRIGHKEHSKHTPVLSAIGAQCGRMFFPDEDFTAIKNTITLTPRDGKCSGEFLYYLLTFVELPRRGAGQPFISKGDIEAFSVALPPISEQRRIIDILDEAFAGIATAKANAEKNLQNARALFESFLQLVFSKRGSGWERITLEELLKRDWIESHLDGNHGGNYPRKNEFVSNGVPYISANCLVGDELDMSRAKYLSQTRANLLRKGISKDKDVLFAHNATVGPVAILRTAETKVILSTSLTYYRCNLKHILPEYLAHYMRSYGFKTQYTSVMRQSTRNQVPITKQREFYHVIPPIDEQKIIVRQLDGLFKSSQLLMRLYERKLTALESLKKSLLHQAFIGELSKVAA